jgi:hypothetical protein
MNSAPVAVQSRGVQIAQKVEERAIDLATEKYSHPNIQMAPSTTMVGRSNGNEVAPNGYYISVHNGVQNTSSNPTHVHHTAQAHAYTYATANGVPAAPPAHTQQQMYATPVTTPGPGVYGPQPPPGYVQYQQQQQQQHNGSPPFQFDLNWPPVEVDGMTQLLSDEHSLDGDFWMSLPNNAQWPTPWPVGTSNVSAMQMNARQGM